MKLRDMIYEFRTQEGTGEGGPSPESVPGTGEPVAGEDGLDPSAETQNTEGNPPPQTIPYTRFKEVNDRRRELEERVSPYLQLEEIGYTADELHRLAQWELEYTQDPVNTWLRHAATLELPEGVKEAIAAQIEAGNGPQPGTTNGDAGNAAAPPSGDDVPEWAKPLMDDLETRRQREAAEADRLQREAHDQMLDGILTGWRQLDEKQKVKSPREETMLNFVIGASRQGETPEEVLKIAREAYLAEREELLRSEMPMPRGGDTPPKPVPGSGSGAINSPPPKPRTLGEASRMAVAAVEAAERDGSVLPLEER